MSVKTNLKNTQIFDSYQQAARLKEHHCQTEIPERRDFQVQVCFQQEGEAISTQTDSSIKCDFQVQANIPRESDSIAVQTIKEEIAMPNLPRSVAQTQAKKRKVSSVSASSSTNTALIDLTMSQTGDLQRPILSRSRVDQLNDKDAALDDVILNSEVYKVYCRNEDPKEARKQIIALKTCFDFNKPLVTEPFPAKEDFKRACEKTLEKLWRMEPRKDSKFAKIRKYVDKEYGYSVYDLDLEMANIFDRFTRILMFMPNGYEYWYVANFEMGPGQSKWYRAESFHEFKASRLVQLNIMGITKATIDRFQNLHYLKKKSEKKSWFDFAYDAIRNDVDILFQNKGDLSVDFKIQEAKTDTTIDVNASMQFQTYDHDSELHTTLEAYHGKSTRSLKKTRQPKNEKEIMEKEAKKAALVEFHKERFGFNKFDDWCVDELCRPIETEQHLQL